MIKWLHHLFNPHCLECTLCKSCETLRAQLELSNYEKKELLNKLLHRDDPIQEPAAEQPRPIIPGHIPWAVRQQTLEAEDRKKSQILKDFKKQQKEIEDLEKKTGVTNVEQA